VKIAVTGSTGFLGTKLVSVLALNEVQGSLFLREKSNDIKGFNTFITPTINGSTQFKAGLHHIDCVIHCAARVHIMNDHSKKPLEEFLEVNTYGTLNLARQAAKAGVKRFIYLSSIKVNGESTRQGCPFSEIDNPVPHDPYGISKYEAEQGLLKIAQDTGLEVVIIRPPLIYGPGVKANFLNMMKLVSKGIPLPLGAVVNKRSFVALDNLVDLICVCIEHPNAKNQVFLAGDGCDVSTTELLQAMAKALGKSSRLVPVPMGLLNLGAKLIGKPAIAQRLCGSLQVDISKAQVLLGWAPPVTMEQGLQKVANAFIQEQGKR